MTSSESISFIKRHGVVLASAKGPVPRLSEVIVGGRIKGSWWAHPKSHQIYGIFRGVSDSKDVLVCRLVNGKVTFVHRRLWAAVARVAKNFSAGLVSQVREEHTASGRHVTREVPFPKWVPKEILERAKNMSKEEALNALGPWARRPTIRSSPARGKRRLT